MHCIESAGVIHALNGFPYCEAVSGEETCKQCAPNDRAVQLLQHGWFSMERRSGHNLKGLRRGRLGPCAFPHAHKSGLNQIIGTLKVALR